MRTVAHIREGSVQIRSRAGSSVLAPNYFGPLDVSDSAYMNLPTADFYRRNAIVNLSPVAYLEHNACSAMPTPRCTEVNAPKGISMGYL